jgi:hypothetical protein
MCTCLNFRRKTPQNIAELDYILQGRLKGIQELLQTVLINYGVPPLQKIIVCLVSNECMQGRPSVYSPNCHAVNYCDAIVHWLCLTETSLFLSFSLYTTLYVNETHTAANNCMAVYNELEEIGEGAVMDQYYSGICLKDLRKRPQYVYP